MNLLEIGLNNSARVAQLCKLEPSRDVTLVLLCSLSFQPNFTQTALFAEHGHGATVCKYIILRFD